MGYRVDPNAKNVWVRDNADTVDLSVQTDANSVYFNNGRTMEQEFGKGVMVSNVVTVDSGMEKVIDGTYDGAYESCKMYGKSLVNLCPNIPNRICSLANDFDNLANIRQSSKEGVQGEGGTIARTLQDLKPNTSYTIAYQLISNNITNEGGYFINNSSVSTVFHTNIIIKRSTPLGWHKEVLASHSDLSDKYIALRHQNGTARGSIEIGNIMILEGDWTDKELPPYFTGLCDVKAPILQNVGKNLFNPMLHKGLTNQGDHYSVDVVGENAPSIEYDVEPNTEYRLNFDKYGSSSKCWIAVSIDGEYSNNSNTNYRKIFTSNGTGKVTISIGGNGKNDLGHTISNIILCKNDDDISYEPYKTNILETSNDIVLRGLPNGVKDSYNCLTGEYVRRVGEVVLNGTQSVSMDGTLTYIHITDLVENIMSMSDTLPSVRVNDILEGVEGVAVQNRGGGSRVYININGLTTAEEITQRLQQKPVTIQYQLAEPIITIIEPSTIPFVYENGHIILESGHEGQSLLPTLEYQTVVSRSGQVAMIDKTIQQHERKITLLEKMLVQNIIDIEYKNTLLALKLEIDEVI